jgi:hypothetical protein
MTGFDAPALRPRPAEPAGPGQPGSAGSAGPGSTGSAGAAARCAPASERRGEQLPGTARPGSRWLLIEHPGPWGFDIPHDSRLPRSVAGALASQAARARVRLLFIRRPGPPADPGPSRRWAYIDARPGREGSWWGSWTNPETLLELPTHGPPDGPRTLRPAYIVCVNGRRDPCCAMRGRPVAAALAAAHPDRTWECSHLGGDRFAANLVILPGGWNFGRLTPATARTVAAAHDRGHLELPWLRGRTSLPPVVQAAQHYARLALAETRVDGLPARAATALDAHTWRVRLGRPGRDQDVWVDIRTGHTAPDRLGCRRPGLEVAPTYDLLDIQHRG